MSAQTLLIVAASSLNLAAALCFVRGARESAPASIRRMYVWARGFAALLLCLAVPVMALAVAEAYSQVDRVAPEHKARTLASGISSAMTLGVLTGVLALPAIACAVLLARKSAGAQQDDSHR